MNFRIGDNPREDKPAKADFENNRHQDMHPERLADQDRAEGVRDNSHGQMNENSMQIEPVVEHRFFLEENRLPRFAKEKTKKDQICSNWAYKV